MLKSDTTPRASIPRFIRLWRLHDEWCDGVSRFTPLEQVPSFDGNSNGEIRRIPRFYPSFGHVSSAVFWPQANSKSQYLFLRKKRSLCCHEIFRLWGLWFVQNILQSCQMVCLVFGIELPGADMSIKALPPVTNVCHGHRTLLLAKEMCRLGTYNYKNTLARKMLHLLRRHSPLMMAWKWEVYM